jgi:hypothetical protein
MLEIKCIFAYPKLMSKGYIIELPWFWNFLGDVIHITIDLKSIVLDCPLELQSKCFKLEIT